MLVALLVMFLCPCLAFFQSKVIRGEELYLLMNGMKMILPVKNLCLKEFFVHLTVFLLDGI